MLRVTLEDGNLVAHIAGAKGRVHPYLVCPLEPGLGQRFAARVSGQDAGTGTYRVTFDDVVGWHCGCWSARTHARKGRYDCKHVCAAYEIATLRGIMTTRPKAKPGELTPEQKLMKALRNPFDPRELKWKPQTEREGKALAVAFIDARAVQDRLDAVVGPLGWRNSFVVQADGSVLCRLEIKDTKSGEWIGKEDVGGESEQPDKHDRAKSAHSDALKRAAVQWGIGRYLYHLPKQWVDYDKQRRRFARVPTLPAWALPNAEEEPPPPEDAPEPEAQSTPAKPAPQPHREEAARETVHHRAIGREQWMVDQKVCEPGELIKHLIDKFGGRHGSHPGYWSDGIEAQVKAECEAFYQARKAQKAKV